MDENSVLSEKEEDSDVVLQCVLSALCKSNGDRGKAMIKEVALDERANKVVSHRAVIFMVREERGATVRRSSEDSLARGRA